MNEENTKPNPVYRIRRGFMSKCVLQRLVDSPSFANGFADSGVRDIRWVDVDYDRAPTGHFWGK